MQLPLDVNGPKISASPCQVSSGLQRSTSIAREASSLPQILPMGQGLEKALALLALPTLELLWTGLTLCVLLVSCCHLCPASVDMLSKGILSHTWWHVFATKAVSLMRTTLVFVGSRLARVWK